MSEKAGAGAGRSSHLKVVQSDSKYGMLLWQSKLQEKLLKEQRESKEMARRRSFEEERLRQQQKLQSHVYRNSNDGGVSTLAIASSPTSIPSIHVNGGENSPGFDGSESTVGESRTVEIPIKMPMPGPSPVIVATDNTRTAELQNQNQQSYYVGGGRSMNRTRLTNNYERDQPMFPKLVTPTLTKLNSSVSCDNIAKSTQQPFGNIALFGQIGGAGAPRRSPSGRLMASLQGHPDIRYHQKDTRGFDQTLRYMMDKEKVIQYREDLDKQVEEKKKWKTSPGATSGGNGVFMGPIKIMSSHDQLETLNQIETRGSESGRRSSHRNGTELAPLIRKYKSLPKLNTLSSTDVTKPFSFTPSPRRGDYSFSPEPEEVARGLSMQLEEKQKIQQIHQDGEKLAAERHFNTWDSFWGRPGHGAPIYYSRGRNSPLGASTSSLFTPRSTHNKTDLFRAIHMTHQQNKRK